MKRIARLLAAVLLVAACSPQVYPLYLDVRQPSKSGLDLSRKSIGIVYMDGTQPADSTFDRNAASAMARHLEEDYFNGDEEVGLYHIPSEDSVTVEQMHSLVMDTGKDVVFLLTSHLGTVTETGGLPVSSRLLVYDSMGEDRILRYSGSAIVAASKEGQPTQAEEVGERMSRRFLSAWKTEAFSFYYFDTLMEDWNTPLEYLNEGRFAKAMDAWMPLTKNTQPTKRACAAYNMAMAFYLLEDYELSRSWLEVADKIETLSLSAGLHKRLDNKK